MFSLIKRSNGKNMVLVQDRPGDIKTVLSWKHLWCQISFTCLPLCHENQVKYGKFVTFKGNLTWPLSCIQILQVEILKYWHLMIMSCRFFISKMGLTIAHRFVVWMQWNGDCENVLIQNRNSRNDKY